MPVFGSLGRSATKSRSRINSPAATTSSPSTHSSSADAMTASNPSTSSPSTSTFTSPATSVDQNSNSTLAQSDWNASVSGKGKLLPPANIKQPSSSSYSSIPSSSLSPSTVPSPTSTSPTNTSPLASSFNPSSSSNTLKKSPSLSRLSFRRKNQASSSSNPATPPVPPLPSTQSSINSEPTTPTLTSSPSSSRNQLSTSPASALIPPPSPKYRPQPSESSIYQDIEIENNNSMLLPPQPAFLGRRSSSASGHGGDSGSSSGYNSRNASTTSFSSSPGGSAIYSDGNTQDSHGERSDRSRNGSMEAHGNISGGFKKERSNSHGASGIKVFGRRLFNRSTPQALNSRSHSTSSSATSQSSPPSTPTTPALPLDALNKRAAASTMSPLTLESGIGEGGLPQLPPLNMGFSNSAYVPKKVNQSNPSSISSNSNQSGSNQLSQSPTSTLSPSSSSQSLGYDPSKTFTSFMPTLPPSSASPPRRNESLPFVTSRAENRGLSSGTPTPTKDRNSMVVDDSDFLRAVLSFGDTDSEVTAANTSSSFSSGYGGFSSSFATSNASRSQQSFRSMSNSSWNSPGIPKTMRESEAREWERRERENAVKTIRPKHRKGLFGSREEDDESEDDYGVEDDEEDEDEDRSRSPSNVKTKQYLTSTDPVSPLRRGSSPSQWPSAKAVLLARSPSGSTQDSWHSLNDDSQAAPPSPQVGLETPGKRSLYTATLLKVHPHLSSVFKPSAGGLEVSSLKSPPSTPAMSTSEIRFPRSINDSNLLQTHSSTLSFSRSLSVAVSRTLVMKRLKKERLPLAQEVEISWFQTKYGSELISPEDVFAGLANRRMVSPEALAVSPVIGTKVSTTSTPALLPSSSSSDTLALASDEKTLKRDQNGLTLWTQRPSFQERCSVFTSENDFIPGDVISQSSSNFGKRLSQQGSRRSVVKPAPLSYSARICALADIAPPTKLGGNFPPPTKFRKRDAGRPAREEIGRTKSTKAPPPWIASRTGPPPAVKQAMDRSASMASLMGTSSNEQSPPQGNTGGLSRSSSISSTVGALPSFSGPTSSTPKRSSTRPSNVNRRTASGRDTTTVKEEDEGGESALQGSDESSEEEEEVPLALLHSHRKERERVAALEAEVQALRAAQQHSQNERERYELAERRRREEAKMAEYNRHVLAEARARRGKTEHSAVLSSNNYGAGNASALSPSASRPDLRQSHSNSRSSKINHSSSMVDLHSGFHPGMSSSPSLYSNRAAVSRGSTSNLPSQNPAASPPARSPSQNPMSLSPPVNTLSPPPLESTRRRSSFNGQAIDAASQPHSGPSSPLIASPSVPLPHRSSTMPNSFSVQQGIDGNMRVSSRQPHRSPSSSQPLLNPSQSQQFGGLLAQQQAQHDQAVRQSQMIAHQAQQMQWQAARQQQAHQSQMMGGMSNSMSMGQVNPYFGGPQPLVSLDPRAVPASATQKFSGWK